MGEREEGVEDAELVEELEGGRVDGVAAEVAEEVLVLFEDGDVDARRARRKPSMMPAGPPPTMQHVVFGAGWEWVPSCGKGSKGGRESKVGGQRTGNGKDWGR